MFIVLNNLIYLVSCTYCFGLFGTERGCGKSGAYGSRVAYKIETTAVPRDNGQNVNRHGGSAGKAAARWGQKSRYC